MFRGLEKASRSVKSRVSESHLRGLATKLPTLADLHSDWHHDTPPKTKGGQKKSGKSKSKAGDLADKSSKTSTLNKAKDGEHSTKHILAEPPKTISTEQIKKETLYPSTSTHKPSPSTPSTAPQTESGKDTFVVEAQRKPQSTNYYQEVSEIIAKHNLGITEEDGIPMFKNWAAKQQQHGKAQQSLKGNEGKKSETSPKGQNYDVAMAEFKAAIADKVHLLTRIYI